MKRYAYLLLILLFCSAASLNAQNDFKLTAKRAGNLGLDDVGEAIVPTLDGGLVMAATFEFTTGDEDDLMLIRLDAAGNLVWAKTWLGGVDIDPLQMVATSNDHFVLLGTYGNQILLAEIDENGDPAWFRLLDEAQENTFASPVGLFGTGNTYTAVFNYDIFSPSNLVQESNVVVQKFDLDGTLGQALHFRHPDDITFQVHAAAAKVNGTIGMVGRLWNGNDNRIDGFYLTINDSDVQAGTIFPNPGDDEMFHIATDMGGQDFFISGYVLREDEMGFSQQRPVVARLDAQQGAIRWSKHPPFEVQQLAHTSSDELYILGYESDAVGENTGDDMHLVRASSTGNPIDQMWVDYSQGITQDEWVNQMTVQGDAQILMVGRSFPGFMNETSFAEITRLSPVSACSDLHNSNPGQWSSVQNLVTADLMLEKPSPPSWTETILDPPTDFITVTDINLDLLSFCNRPTSTGSLADLGWQLELAPNPVRDRLTITLTGPNELISGHLLIRNATGQLVWQDPTVRTGNRSVNLQQLPPGYYWFTYQNRQGSITAPFVKQ